MRHAVRTKPLSKSPQVALAAYWSGRVELILGNRAEAAQAFAAADALRDEILLELTLGTARERADASWDLAAQALAELHLTGSTPDPRAALEIVRRARTRAFAVLAQWSRLSAEEHDALGQDIARTRARIEESARQKRSVLEERRALEQRRAERRALRERLRVALPPPESTAAAPLRRPEQGELVLTFYPIGDRWARFADDGDELRASLFSLPAMDAGDSEWSTALIEPFADMIERARLVRVIASGKVLDRDVHGLPLSGRGPLLAQVPVVYALDRPGATSVVQSPLSSALLVPANPGRPHDTPPLEFIEAEATHVLAAWRRAGITPREIRDADATRERVLAALAEVELFHFSGHGAPRQELRGSTDLWDRELLLGGASSLSVEDILGAKLVRAPRGVVLSACQTVMVEPRAHSGGLALGHSFLLRGAEFVIATSRAINDAEAVQFIEALYARAAGGRDLADPAALARTQRDLLGGESCGERPTICAYRFWVQ